MCQYFGLFKLPLPLCQFSNRCAMTICINSWNYLCSTWRSLRYMQLGLHHVRTCKKSWWTGTQNLAPKRMVWNANSILPTNMKPVDANQLMLTSTLCWQPLLKKIKFDFYNSKSLVSWFMPDYTLLKINILKFSTHI